MEVGLCTIWIWQMDYSCPRTFYGSSRCPSLGLFPTVSSFCVATCSSFHSSQPIWQYLFSLFLWRSFYPCRESYWAVPKAAVFWQHLFHVAHYLSIGKYSLSLSSATLGVKTIPPNRRTWDVTTAVNCLPFLLSYFPGIRHHSSCPLSWKTHRKFSYGLIRALGLTWRSTLFPSHPCSVIRTLSTETVNSKTVHSCYLWQFCSMKSPQTLQEIWNQISVSLVTTVSLSHQYITLPYL